MIELTCARCQGRFPVGPRFGCPTCREQGRAEPLEPRFQLDGVGPELAAALARGPGRRGPDDPGIWRWRALLPSLGVELTLGEGATPLLRSRRAGPGLGLEGLLLKYEGANPTGSFKDRFQAVSMSVARSLGFERAFCASTGNHGLAAAAYARLAGLACLVLLHEESPSAFDEAIADCGATVARVPAAERDGLMRDLLGAGWFPATCLAPLPVPNPFGAEGYKTIAYELLEQLGAAPDAVVVPVGAGDGFYGLAKGFVELAELGLIARPPPVYAVQPRGADALVLAASRAGADEVAPLDAAAPSAALSIREAATGGHALRLLRQTGGGAVAVDDAEILAAAARLAEEPLTVDVASAASVAGAAALAGRGLLPRTARVVALLTAAGARWPRPASYPISGRVLRGAAADVLRLVG
jgi:threonine synthase